MNQMDIRRKQIALFTYMIGMVIFPILSRELGDNGIAYVAAAGESYILLYLLTVAALPETIEYLIRTRNAKGQYKNAHRIFKTAICFAVLVSLLLTVLAYVLSSFWMDRVLLLPGGKLVFQLLLPSYFIASCSAVLKGYFQGNGISMPSEVSQVVKLIFFLTFGFIFAYILGDYGKKAAILLQNMDFAGMYTGGGVALGWVLAYVLSFLFLLFVYMGAGRNILKKQREGLRLTENYPGAIRSLWISALPLSVLLVLWKLPDILGLFLFQRIREDIWESAHVYGVFYGRYQIWIYISMLILGIGILSMSSKISNSIKREEYKQAKEYMQIGITWTLMWGTFFTAFFVSSGERLAAGIYGTREKAVSYMMVWGSPVTIFMALGLFFLIVLWKSGGTKRIFIYLPIAVSLYVITLIGLMEMNQGKVENLAYAQLILHMVLCLAGGFFVLEQLRFRMDWFRSVLFPLLSALISGFVMWVLGLLLADVLPNLWNVLICLLAGLFSHIVLLFFLRCVRERDYGTMPGGKIFIGIGKMLHF